MAENTSAYHPELERKPVLARDVKDLVDLAGRFISLKLANGTARSRSPSESSVQAFHPLPDGSILCVITPDAFERNAELIIRCDTVLHKTEGNSSGISQIITIDELELNGLADTDQPGEDIAAFDIEDWSDDAESNLIQPLENDDTLDLEEEVETHDLTRERFEEFASHLRTAIQYLS